jgi:hypothetical protein
MLGASMTAAFQPPRTAPARSPGSRFLASPCRRNARAANRLAGPKTAPGIFFSAPPKTRRETPSQSLGTHQESATYVFVFASGCAVAPNSGGGSSNGSGSTLSFGQKLATYAGGAVLTQPVFSLLLGSNNQSFLGNWLMGTLPSQINYPENSPEMLDMEQSPGANVMRQRFYANGEQSTNNLFFGTGQAYVSTVYDPYNTAFQVGGFAGASVVNNGDGTATYTITNVAGENSFFYHMVPDDPAPSGPMSNVTQVFQWTEPIPGNQPVYSWP